jgi:hypothetical protein
MTYSTRTGILSIGFAFAALICPRIPAQAPAAAAAAPRAAADRPAGAEPQGPFRRLAPGVLRSIDPEVKLEETYSWHDLVELLADDPNLDWAKNIAFRRDIWHLDFQCKPLRTVYVDLPQPGGRMQRTQVRYLVYSVTNKGKAMHPVQAEDGTYKIEPLDMPVRFAPKFTLECPKYHEVYPDQILPLAMEAIRRREDPHRPFYNSVEMCREIPVGQTLWGIATWEGIDPRVKEFSIYVQGLTNAYRWEDVPGRYKKGDALGTGRYLSRKTLQLNYWRPGEESPERETEIPLGAPGAVDYAWVYR